MQRARETLETLPNIVCHISHSQRMRKTIFIKIVRSTADTVYITHTLWLLLSSGQFFCTVKTLILLRCITDNRHKCIVLRYFTLFAIQLERITNHLDKIDHRIL